jgi:acetyl esterase
VVTAEFDPLRDQGEAYARRLQAAGTPCDYRRYDGQIHGFFGFAGVVPRAREAQLEAARRVIAVIGAGAAAQVTTAG